MQASSLAYRIPAPVPAPVLDLAPTPTPVPALDLAAIKARQQATWSSGDFGHVGVRLQIVGESLCEAADVGGADRVLDVAAGNGNASLAAARRFATVTSTDYVPALLEQGRQRAQADRLDIEFVVADAERLPFPDASFDVALSTFGVMFAPDQERAAAELLRVVKPGGRIALATWPPSGFIGEVFDVASGLVPPPAGLRSPMEWGTEARLAELFAGAADVRAVRRTLVFRYRSAEHWLDFFSTWYGPTVRTLGALDAGGRALFRDAMLALARRWNRGRRGELTVAAEYLEVVIRR